MNQSPFTIDVPSTVQVSAALEPVRAILLSLWALSADETLTTNLVPVDAWITQNATRLTAEQRAFNRLLFSVFGSALLLEDMTLEFPSYLDALAAQPIELWQERLTGAIQSAPESTLRSEAESLLGDPAVLHRQIVAHLSTLWDGLLAAEWKRYTGTLRAGEWKRSTGTLMGMTRSLNEITFSQPRWQELRAASALRALLLTELTDSQLEQLTGVKRIVLVLSPHLLVYCNRFGSSDTLYVVRKFDPRLMRLDPIRRAEVLSPLSALADETRLRILEMLSEKGEQRAQEIIMQIEGSQGNISRHLKQLVAAGFVRERRAGDANKLYEYDDNGLDRLYFLLRQLLSSHNVESVRKEQESETRLQQVRSAAPPLLAGLLDGQGRITRWSSKLKDQEAIFYYLISKFEVERGYSEQQVNELLRQWYLDDDFVLVRRGLVDAKLLNRTKDGARYWRDLLPLG